MDLSLHSSQSPRPFRPGHWSKKAHVGTVDLIHVRHQPRDTRTSLNSSRGPTASASNTCSWREARTGRDMEQKHFTPIGQMAFVFPQVLAHKDPFSLLVSLRSSSFAGSQLGVAVKATGCSATSSLGVPWVLVNTQFSFQGTT